MVTPPSSSGGCSSRARPHGVAIGSDGSSAYVEEVRRPRQAARVLEFEGGAGEREPATPSASLPHPHGEPGEHRGRREVAGGVIEGLHGKRRRHLGRDRPHSGLGDAARHLHEAVEAAPTRPRAGVPVGVERDVDESGPGVSAHLLAEPEVLERVGAVAVHDDVAAAQQLDEPAQAVRVARVEARRPLAERHVGNERGFLPVGRVDAQHVGAEAGQQAESPPVRRARE